MPLALAAPPLALAVRLIPQALAGGASAAGGGGFMAFVGRAIMGGGLISLADDLLENVGIDLWPDDPRGSEKFTDVVGDLDGMIASGMISVPPLRRDGTTSPPNYLTVNLNKNAGDPGFMFIHPEYFSRKSIAAARRVALTPATKITSAPRRARRR